MDRPRPWADSNLVSPTHYRSHNLRAKYNFNGSTGQITGFHQRPRPVCSRCHALWRIVCRAGVARQPGALSAGPRTGGVAGKPGPRAAPIQSRREFALSPKPGRQTTAVDRAMAGPGQAAGTSGNPARHRVEKRNSPRHPPGHHFGRNRPVHHRTGQRPRRHRPDRMA